MNLYECVVEDVLWQEAIDPDLGGPWYQEDVDEWVFAETPGKAKVAFYNKHRRNVDYIDIRCRCLLRNVDRAAGFYNDPDPLYLQIHPEHAADYLEAFPELAAQP